MPDSISHGFLYALMFLLLRGTRGFDGIPVVHLCHYLIENPLGGDHRRPFVLGNREIIPDSWRHGKSCPIMVPCPPYS